MPIQPPLTQPTKNDLRQTQGIYPTHSLPSSSSRRQIFRVMNLVLKRLAVVAIHMIAAVHACSRHLHAPIVLTDTLGRKDGMLAMSPIREKEM